MAVLIPVTQVDAWAETTFLRASGFVAATTDLLSQPVVQAEVSSEIIGQLATAASRLPPGIDRTLIRGGVVRASVIHAVPRLLDSQALRTVWRTAVGELHPRLLTVLRNRSPVLKIRGSALSIDVPVAVAALLAAARLPSALARALPRQLPVSVTVLEGGALQRARIAVRITEDSRHYVDPAVALLGFVGVAAARRRIRASQLGLAAGALTAAAAWFIVDLRATPTGSIPIASTAAKAFISPLQERLAVAAAILAALLVGATLLLKPTREIGGPGRHHRRSLSRSRLRPLLRQTAPPTRMVFARLR